MTGRQVSHYDERESLRHALLRVGLELDGQAVDALIPQARMLRQSVALVGQLDLSAIEPGLAFDARWKM